MVIQDTVAEAALARPLAAGADFAEIFVERTSVTTIRLDGGVVEALARRESTGAGVRVVSGASTGFAHTGELTSTALSAAADLAVEASNAQRASREVKRRSAASSGDAAGFPPDSAPHDAGAKLAVLAKIDAAARAEDSAIRNVVVLYDDVVQDVSIVNSDGVSGRDRRVRTAVRITAVSDGTNGVQTGIQWLGKSMGFELFDHWDVEELARAAAQAALRKQRARAGDLGDVPVVLGPGAGAILIHEACGHGLEADLVQAGASVYAGRVGENVASPLITVVDDATLDAEFGSFAIDDEGQPANRTVLIEDGVLRSYLFDRRHADRAGETSTGNGRRQSYQHLPMVRMSNTIVSPGSLDPEAIVRDTDRGLYVRGLGGGEVNTATGDFVFGVNDGYLIENGEITEPVLPTSVIGNGPDVLRRIDAVGNDHRMSEFGAFCGKVQSAPVGLGQPTLRVPTLTVGTR